MLIGFSGNISKIELGDMNIEDFSHIMLQKLKPGNKKYKLNKRENKTYLDALLSYTIDIEEEYYYPIAQYNDILYLFSDMKLIYYKDSHTKKLNEDDSVDFTIGYDDNHFGLSEFLPECFNNKATGFQYNWVI